MDMNWMQAEVARLMDGQRFAQGVTALRSQDHAEAFASQPWYTPEGCFAVGYQEVAGGESKMGILLPEWMAVSKDTATFVLAHELGHFTDPMGETRWAASGERDTPEKMMVYVDGEQIADRWAVDRLGVGEGIMHQAMGMTLAHSVFALSVRHGKSKEVIRRRINRVSDNVLSDPTIRLRFGMKAVPPLKKYMCGWLDELTKPE